MTKFWSQRNAKRKDIQYAIVYNFLKTSLAGDAVCHDCRLLLKMLFLISLNLLLSDRWTDGWTDERTDNQRGFYELGLQG